MLRAVAVLGPGGWSMEVADTVVLDHDARHRRRIGMCGVRGLEFLLDLPEAIVLRGGDALQLDDGRLVEVVAAPEPLIEIRAADAAALARLAWHLGNRHLPIQVVGARLRMRRDHVVEEMLRGLGARVTDIEAPFDPEAGAYSTAHDHAHAHHGPAHPGHTRHRNGHAGHEH